jgi:hypothetical protein
MAQGDYVKIDTSVTTATLANDLIAMVEAIRTVINQVEKVNGALSNMTDATIEAEYGLITGKGAATRTLVGSCRSAVRSPATLGIIDQYGR